MDYSLSKTIGVMGALPGVVGVALILNRSEADPKLRTDHIAYGLVGLSVGMLFSSFLVNIHSEKLVQKENS